MGHFDAALRRGALEARSRFGGDKYVEDDVPATYSGVPVLDVPMFPEAQGPGANATSILLTDPKNINVGIWRNIRVEVDKRRFGDLRGVVIDTAGARHMTIAGAVSVTTGGFGAVFIADAGELALLVHEIGPPTLCLRPAR